MKFKEREPSSILATKTKKMHFFVYTHEKYRYVGKVPKIIFENLTKKFDQF